MGGSLRFATPALGLPACRSIRAREERPCAWRAPTKAPGSRQSRLRYAGPTTQPALHTKSAPALWRTVFGAQRVARLLEPTLGDRRAVEPAMEGAQDLAASLTRFPHDLPRNWTEMATWVARRHFLASFRFENCLRSKASSRRERQATGARRRCRAEPGSHRRRRGRERLERLERRPCAGVTVWPTRLAIDDGTAPLALILSAMRALCAKATAIEGELDLRYAFDACELAKHAAPYLHPKLSSVDTATTGAITVKKLIFVVDDKGNAVCEHPEQ